MRSINIFLCLVLLSSILVHNRYAQPLYWNYSDSTGGENLYPLNTATGRMVQWLVAPGEFNQPSSAPSGFITSISFRLSNSSPLQNQLFWNLYILLGQTSLTSFQQGAFYTGNLDTVYKRTTVYLSAYSGSWLTFILDSPYPFNNAQSLVIQVEQCGTTGSGGTLCHTSLSNTRRNYSGACTYPWVYQGQNNIVVNCGITIAVPQHYNFNTAGGDNSFPLNQPNGKMCQWLVGPHEFNQPVPVPPGYWITAMFFRISSTYPLGPVTYNNFHILLGQTSLTSLPTSSFYTGAIDTVYKRTTITFQAAVNSWMFVPLDSPFEYNPAMSLVVQVGQCSATGTTTGFSLTHTNLSGFRRCWSVGGCPFVYAGQGVNVLNCGINVRHLGAVSGNFQVPDAYRLDQNYPNPFNPSTTINFGIPKGSNVKLTVYDILGREVEILVNEFRAPGIYSVNFDASNYASGVYLYKLETEGFIDTKKLQLIK